MTLERMREIVLAEAKTAVGWQCCCLFKGYDEDLLVRFKKGDCKIGFLIHGSCYPRTKYYGPKRRTGRWGLWFWPGHEWTEKEIRGMARRMVSRDLPMREKP